MKGILLSVSLCLSLMGVARAATTQASSGPATGPGVYLDPHCGGRQVMVQLFEWRWADVAAECERFLGPKGFCGVQVSPPNEHVLVDNPPDPWWERYEPVSYLLTSRSGSQAEFIDMVDRCKAVGVRIYVDAVFNNMAGIALYGQGTAGSSYDSDVREYNAVPYDSSDFNSPAKCPSGDNFVNDYNNPDEVRNCSYLGWSDLDQSNDHVRQMISAYLNQLIQLGVAGFRIALAKYMWPEDLEAIESLLQDLPEGGRPFIIHHVLDYGKEAIKTSEYTPLGYVTEFRYGAAVSQVLSGGQLEQLRGLDHHGRGQTPSDHALVFVDNHETQREQHGNFTHLSFREPALYTMASAFTLAYDYGLVRVMSSYNFTSKDDGPPSNADRSTKAVPILADGSCGDGWVCEHRWPQIASMVRFRNEVTDTDVNHWSGQPDFVAFSRGHRGFFAMTSSPDGVQMDLRTGLPAGRYCDVITQCGRTVTVDGHGMVSLDLDAENNILAILESWPVPDPTETINTFQPTGESSVLSTTEPADLVGLESSTTLWSAVEVSSSLPSSTQTAIREDFQSTSIDPFQALTASFDGSQSSSTDLYLEQSFTYPPLESSSYGTSESVFLPEPSSTGAAEVYASSDSASFATLGSSSRELYGSSETVPQFQTSSDYPTQSSSESWGILSSSSDAQLQPSSAYSSAGVQGPSDAYPSLPSSWTQAESSSLPGPVLPLSSTVEPYFSSTEFYPVTSTSLPPTASVTIVTTPETATAAATTTTTATTPPPTTPSPYKRTVILQHWVTGPNDYLFFRGGSADPGCTGSEAHSDPCAIPIRDHDEGYTIHFDKYNAWRQGDNYLDWHGPENGQGRYQSSQEAQGTPGIWTTNQMGKDGFSFINKYGEHYWLLDVEMDCSRLTDTNGFFQVKGFSLATGWEHLDTTSHPCGGSGAIQEPTTAVGNHYARCGYVNVYKDGGGCEIISLQEAGITETSNLFGLSAGTGGYQGVPIVG